MQQVAKHPQKYLAILIAALFMNGALAETTTSVGTVTVEGHSGSGTGLIMPEESAKARSSVSKSYLESQPASSNPYQSLALLPGVNSFSIDATGLFGGTMSMRGFNSDQLGVTIDGAPVNDSGNFAVYPQEYVDSENLQELFVTQGSTDTEAPHVGASGGNVGIVSVNPRDTMGGRLAQTLGSNKLSRTFVRFDSGKVADGKAAAFVSYSKSKADKWRGLGSADRNHVDMKLTSQVSPGINLSTGLVYNTAVNNFFKNITMAQYNANGRNFDYSKSFPTLAAPNAATAQNDSTAIGGVAATDYYGLAVNPFQNYIATFKANVQLNDTMRVDVEPYFWHGYGGGGFGTTLAESNAALSALNGGARLDLNGDGNTTIADTTLFYRSSVTKTNRPGVTTKFNWNVDNHKVMLGLWYERAEHVQTQPYVRVNADGTPMDVWAENSVVKLANGNTLQGRDWKTISTSSQLFLQDSVGLLNDKLNLVVGIRAPQIKRDGTNGLSTGNTTTVKNVSATYNEVLPNVGVKYQVSEAAQVFANVAKNMRAPSNFVLYDTSRTADAKPEQSTNIDIGYRHQAEGITFSGSMFMIDFKDRFASVRDSDGTSRTYNAGNVKSSGFELELGNDLGGGLSTYTSFSYLDSKLTTDFTTRNASKVLITLPTHGKTFVDAPKMMAGLGLQYQLAGWVIGGQAKYTGKRYSTLMNDEALSGFTTADLNAAYTFGDVSYFKNAKLKLNIINAFDKVALGMINSNQTNATAFTSGAVTLAASTPNYTPLAPRTFSVMIGADL